MKNILNILAIILAFSLNVSSQVPAQTVPNFTFFRLNNDAFCNKDLELSKMLFFVFFDSDCEHCQRAITNLNQNYQLYKKIAIYLITLDDRKKIDHFMNMYGQNLKDKKNVTILQDQQNEFLRKFNPRRYPSMFLYSPVKKLLDYEDNEKGMFRVFKIINTAVK